MRVFARIGGQEEWAVGGGEEEEAFYFSRGRGPDGRMNGCRFGQVQREGQGLGVGGGKAEGDG
jgi:hypothetical protein